MTAFEFFSVALSLVLGLGLTRLLLGGRYVFLARRRQRAHWIPIAWAISIFIFQIQYWWAVFALQSSIETWTHGKFVSLLLAAILLFIAGALILPTSDDGERDDLLEYFEQDGRWALLAIAAYAALSMWVNWFLFDESPVSSVGMIVVVVGLTSLAAFMVRNRHIRGVLTAGFLIVAVWGFRVLAPAGY